MDVSVGVIEVLASTAKAVADSCSVNPFSCQVGGGGGGSGVKVYVGTGAGVECGHVECVRWRGCCQMENGKFTPGSNPAAAAQ